MTRRALTSRTLIFAASSVSLLVSSGAAAQSLSQRIDHVMQQRSAAAATNNSKSHLLSTLLYTDVSAQFSETPLRDVMKYLETVLGINLAPRYSDDRNANGEGMDPDAPITLNVESMPAITVIEMVLSQLDEADAEASATWQLRDGFVEIGTKSRLSVPSAREIRYYPIRDLLFEPPQFENAPELDLESALNQAQNTGSGGAGGGSGGGFGGGGGGSGGGAGGGGGAIFGEPGDDPERLSEAEKAQAIIDLITETVEPDAWDTAGGDTATIRYYQGTLIIRAPDFIQRQIGGYPFAVRPINPAAVRTPGPRYITFSVPISNVEIAGIRVSPPFTGAPGGSGGVELPGSTTIGAGTGAAPASVGSGKPAATSGVQTSKP
jgi:uncharacterized membrane protein YgcG